MHVENICGVYTQFFLYSVTWDGNQIVLCTEIPVIIKYVNKFEIQNKRKKKKKSYENLLRFGR